MKLRDTLEIMVLYTSEINHPEDSGKFRAAFNHRLLFTQTISSKSAF